MSDLYKMYHAERMRAYRARLKAARPVIVKVKKQPMSVRERVRLYRERKKQLLNSQSLDSCVPSVSGGDNMRFDSESAQTVILPARQEKKPPMSAKERVRLYRQRQKELWEKYRASTVAVPSVSAETLTVKKQPISGRERVKLHRERKKQLWQENQILDLSVSAASRGVENEISLGTQNSKKLHLNMYSAPFLPFLFFERLMDGIRADSQNRSDIISKRSNMKDMNTCNSINRDETDCNKDNRLLNQVRKGDNFIGNRQKQNSDFCSVPVSECIKQEYEEENAPVIREEIEEKGDDAYSEDDDESTIVTDYCKLVMEDEESLNSSKSCKSCEEHSSDEDYIENEAENVDRRSFYSCKGSI